MKRNLGRFAPLGLYLALLAALVSIGLYIVYREFNLSLQISLALIVIGLASFAVLDPARVRSGLTGRQARYGSNALIMSIAFLGILIVLNYVVFQNPKRWDFTEDKEFTLAKETIETLQKLPQPVTAQAFFTPNTNRTEAEGLLNQYKFHSRGKFEYEFIDPLVDPGAAEAANITSDGSISLRMGDRRENVTFASEDELTGAVVRMMGEKMTIYFLIGHGEYSPEDSGDQSLSSLKSLLEAKNYVVKTLSLLAEKTIPDDARVIIVAGPEKPLTEAEITTFSAYLANGGSAVILEETPLVIDMGGADPLADYLATGWGINLGNDVVLDFGTDSPAIAYAYQYGQHAITDGMRLSSGYYTARSIQTAPNKVEGVNITDLVQTAPFPSTYAETDLEGLENNINPEVDDAKDVKGPVTIAVVAENTPISARLVIFGDRDFASNQFINGLGNGEIAVNAIDWATEQENLISLTPKSTTSRLMVPPTRVAIGLILLGSIFVVPGLVLVVGIVVWIQRRKRG